MEKPVYDVVRNMAHQAASPEDFEDRVLRIFGSDMLAQARAVFVSVRGQDWETSSVDVAHKYAHQSEDSVAPRRIEVTLPPKISVHIERPARAAPLAPKAADIPIPPLKKYSIWALAGGVACLLALILFPPFIVPLQGGLVTNAGFSFIFSPPPQGSLLAIVNVPLLTVLGALIATATCGLYVLFRQIEHQQPSFVRPP